MTYRDSFRRRIRLPTLTLADWIVLSFAQAMTATAGFVLALVFLVPRHYGIDDLFANSLMFAGAFFLFNLLAAALLRILFHLVKLLRRRSTN
jgi:hypothetical protein